MTGTLVNVASGSGLKVVAYVFGQFIDGYFRNKQLTLQALNDKADRIVQLNSGTDNLSPYSAVTRRVIAWAFSFTACFILVTFALDASQSVPILTDREAGIFGWIIGSKNQTVETVSKGQMIMNMWPLLEIMFGFYFTKVGKS